MDLFKRLVAVALIAAGLGALSQFAAAVERTERGHRALQAGNPVGKETLADIVRLVRTETEFADRSIEFNVGSGFVVGRYFITVYHNLTASRSLYVRQTVSVDGVALRPIFTDESQDVAVFELTDELCRRYCNELRVAVAPRLERGRPVYWISRVEASWQLKESTILNLAVFDLASSRGEDSDAFGCANNLVVEVEEPFIAGSSGSPVVDALTGQIVGIIQGSFDTGNKRTGYFKPIHCLRFQQALYAPGHFGARS